MKILKKVRLINWHRFQDETIEFAESVLLSGENGAGKSTTLKMILGLVRPTQGEIQVFGQPMN